MMILAGGQILSTSDLYDKLSVLKTCKLLLKEDIKLHGELVKTLRSRPLNDFRRRKSSWICLL